MTAAFAGYLNDLSWPFENATFTLLQGQDMGMPSLIEVQVPQEQGSAVSVSGRTRKLY